MVPTNAQIAMQLAAAQRTAKAARIVPTSAKAKPLQVVTADHDVTAAVDKFRALLGPDNGDKPGGNPNGHREINWDGVPDEFASPNALPADFFNAKTHPGPAARTWRVRAEATSR